MQRKFICFECGNPEACIVYAPLDEDVDEIKLVCPNSKNKADFVEVSAEGAPY